MDFKEFRAKTVDDAITDALVEFETTSDKLEYEVIEEGSTGLLGLFSRDAIIRARKKEEPKDKLLQFLEDVLEKMEVEGTIEITTDEEEKIIDINIEGENTKEIIGRKGQCLDSLQYLASIVANQDKEEYYRVKLDTKNYRERRQKTLENMAKNTANKVRKTRRKVVLDPMNPYERRIIHSYLQNEKHVTTKSEGEDPYRRVVVYYKR